MFDGVRRVRNQFDTIRAAEGKTPIGLVYLIHDERRWSSRRWRNTDQCRYVPAIIISEGTVIPDEGRVDKWQIERIEPERSGCQVYPLAVLIGHGGRGLEGRGRVTINNLWRKQSSAKIGREKGGNAQMFWDPMNVTIFRWSRLSQVAMAIESFRDAAAEGPYRRFYK